MATVINSYSVSLGMDASNFIDGAKVSRSEMRQLVKDIQAAQTPVEKFAVEQDRLKRALDSGAISQSTYNRLLESKRPAIEAATSSLPSYTAALTAATAGIAAASAATVAFITQIRSVQSEIDDTADKAERLGVSFGDLKTLEFGFDRGGGVGPEAVGEAIKKLQINIAKAVEGDDKLRESFAKLGLDAGELIAEGPRQALLRLADVMPSLNFAERLRVSTELLGKGGAELASTLGKGREELEESLGFAEKWLSLTEQQVQMVGANNHAWRDVSVIVTGITNTVAAELAPVMQLVAESILRTADGLGDVDTAIRSTVDATAQWAGDFLDGMELTLEVAKKLQALRSLDVNELTKFDPEAFQLDSGERIIENLNRVREEGISAAEEAEINRLLARHAMVMEDTDKEREAKLKAIDDIAKEEERRQQEKERLANRNAEQALRAAERYFEEERRKQMKMQEDVARGPGSGMEAGSAEAARFMAEQANRAIAEATVKVDGKPTDEQLVEQAKIQAEILRANGVRQEELINATKDVGRKVEEIGMEGV